MTGLSFEYVEITTKGDKLHMSAGGNEGHLSSAGEVGVFEGDNGTKIKFSRGSSKKVGKITLQAQGFSFEGSKE